MPKKKNIFLMILSATICTLWWQTLYAEDTTPDDIIQVKNGTSADSLQTESTMPADSLRMEDEMSKVVVTSDNDTIRMEDILSDKEARYSSLFQKAIAEFIAGKNEEAFTMLNACVAEDSTASEAFFYLSKYYEAKGEDSLATAMMVRAAELQPENVTYKEALIPHYLITNDLQRAIDTIEDIVEEDPERTDMLEVLLKLYSHTKDNKKCLETLERIELQEGPDERISMTKVQLYSSMGEEKKARKEMDALVKNNPLDLNFRVMRGNWLLQQGKSDEALEDFEAVMKEEPDNENAIMSMMDYHRSNGNDSIAETYRDRLLLSPKTQQDTKLLILKQVIRAKEQETSDSTEVLRLFDRILEEKQPDTNILEMKIAYMQLKEMPDEEIKKALKKMLEENPGSASARYQLILHAWREGKPEEMIALAKPALEYNPEVCGFRHLLATAYFLTDDVQQCVKTLEEATKIINENEEKDLAVEIYSLLGDALHKAGEKEKAFEAYENCLRLNPEKISCLNNYAYYLSVEKQELDKAAAMSLKTIKAEPDNATYLDTYAWIMYQLERYEEARTYIDLAMKYIDEEEKDNPESEIVKHQKAIYLKVGAVDIKE